MSKRLLFIVVAIAAVIAALFLFRRGRIMISAILVTAAFCFVAAAVGTPRGPGGRSL